jgi:hypothetical protein
VNNVADGVVDVWLSAQISSPLSKKSKLQNQIKRLIACCSLAAGRDLSLPTGVDH